VLQAIFNAETLEQRESSVSLYSWYFLKLHQSIVQLRGICTATTRFVCHGKHDIQHSMLRFSPSLQFDVTNC